jgi:hypothetical protein
MGVGGHRGFETALVPAFRRVDGVRLIVGDGPLRAEVYGIGHRLPARVRVSIGLAARLVEAGALLTVTTLPSTGTLEGVA